jgi:hypothetical protein
MYQLHVNVYEHVGGVEISAALSDIDDTGSVSVVATHGPLMLEPAVGEWSDLGVLLYTAERYLAQLNPERNVVSGVASSLKAEKD